MNKEPWPYNPINYYLLIFKKTKVVVHVCHTSVYDAVSHLLNWGSSDEMEITRQLKPGIVPNVFLNYWLLQKELDNVLSRNFSNAIRYDDGTFGVIFTSQWINKQDIKDIKGSNDSILIDIYSLITSLERDKKLSGILQ